MILIYGIIIMFVFTKIFAALIENNAIVYFYYGILLSVISSLIFKGINDEYAGTYRATLSFNNPNQLAYFAVIILSFIILLQNYRIQNNISNIIYSIFDIIILIMVHLFIIMSVSRGGIITILALDIVYLLNINDRRYSYFDCWCILDNDYFCSSN